MGWLTAIVKFFLVGLVVTIVAAELYSNRSKIGFVWSIWKRFRFKMLLEILGLFTAVAAAISLMFKYLPFLSWGWLNLLISSGGNIITAPVLEGSGSSIFLIRLLVPLFFIALLIAMPFLAKSEEKVFRKGAYQPKKIIIRSVIFGLMHLIVGIPVAAGIALIGAGLFLAYKYRKAVNRIVTEKEAEKIKEAKGKTIEIEMSWEESEKIEKEALLVSTTYHTLWNSIFVGLIIALSIASI